MRKLIMWNIITLDGYFEGDKNWDLSFHEIVWGPELEQISIAQLKAADYLVFGRVTYEGMAAYWKPEKGEIAELMNKIPKLVCSRTLDSVDWNNSTLVKGNTSSEISKLKAQGGGDTCFLTATFNRRTYHDIQSKIKRKLNYNEKQKLVA